MMLPLKHVSFSIFLGLCFQVTLGSFISSANSTGELSASSSNDSSTCSCTSGGSGTEGYPLAANCSAFCNCKPGEVANANGVKSWTCSCASDGVARPLYINNAGCFSSCNCTFSKVPDLEEPGKSESSSKQISSKAVVYTLLACILLTTIVLLASIICCLSRKEIFPVQSSIFSVGSEASVNSSSNLISHRPTSLKESRATKQSYFNLTKGWLWMKHYMRTVKKDRIPGSIIQFTYAELDRATNKFSNSNLIGIGESCNVYHGQLKDGRDVAVKRLEVRKGSDADIEFLTEVEMIARLNHFNIVPLLGYCSVSQGKYCERLQIFEYMPNGNLRCHLDAKQKEPLDWATRVGIAIGAAKGLEYLHEAAAPRILHRDVKSSNILLDSNWRAKISDLGMAKRIANDDQPSCPSSPARMLGTFGYFAPEYAITGRASLKSDVFSFGVVLLELISGRPPIILSAKKGQESLVMWALSLLKDSKHVVKALTDPLLEGKFPEVEVLVMSQLARECLNFDPDLRPTMAEVVQILSTITPDKRTRKFSLQFMQGSWTDKELRGYGSDSGRTEKQEPQVIHDTSVSGVNAEVHGASHQWTGLRCPPLELDMRQFTTKQGSRSEVPSMGHVGQLALLTSKSRSWRSIDEEEASSVDLMEPRLEKFWESNLHCL
ncbi:receptor-like serine/threonine-protein kinase NCRK isoform X2 [Nymphaea colorata]|uniref:receptor-like serine/threonine-protein kinase NCRK isoform X2 n=1 Tax=Nymphaea colorata TaxID=210225 RepID=UPI00214F45C8|nr:receptor-like serine/threonine-protein kinase NCRK isoform X2 [Nymphaea colorata]